MLQKELLESASLATSTELPVANLRIKFQDFKKMFEMLRTELQDVKAA